MEYDYDELVQACLSIEIDELQFLAAQPDLMELFLKEMKGSPLTRESAREWLSKHENNNLYQ
ncbi:MAG: hypothetical protein LBP56_10565 [Odoribacteraceae bacterium]|jgi:hypothetical protein|nr:hypothetical protein [Odoribacteraceae bacterium]